MTTSKYILRRSEAGGYVRPAVPIPLVTYCPSKTLPRPIEPSKVRVRCKLFRVYTPRRQAFRRIHCGPAAGRKLQGQEQVISTTRIEVGKRRKSGATPEATHRNRDHAASGKMCKWLMISGRKRVPMPPCGVELRLTLQQRIVGIDDVVVTEGEYHLRIIESRAQFIDKPGLPDIIVIENSNQFSLRFGECSPVVARWPEPIVVAPIAQPLVGERHHQILNRRIPRIVADNHLNVCPSLRQCQREGPAQLFRGLVGGNNDADLQTRAPRIHRCANRWATAAEYTILPINGRRSCRNHRRHNTLSLARSACEARKARTAGSTAGGRCWFTSSGMCTISNPAVKSCAHRSMSS